MRSLENFMNWLTDMNSGWWPFLCLRPEKNQQIDNRILLKISIYFGPFYGATLTWLAIVLKLANLPPYFIAINALLIPVLFFPFYKFTFALFWNRRARRLQELHHEASSSQSPTIAQCERPSRLSFPLKLLRMLAMMGNGLLALMPVFYLLSNRSLDLSIFLISAYCFVLAGCSALALVSRAQKRPYVFGAIVLNALVVILFLFIVISVHMSGLRDFTAMFLLIMPVALNLAAVILVHMSQVRTMNSVAT